MQRNVYLQGELAEKFGEKFVVQADSYSDVFKCIQANRPNFLPYVRRCHEEDINFIVDTEEGSIDQDDLIRPVAKGDITIALAPAGSKSGIGKILAAIAIVVVMIYAPTMFGQVTTTTGTGAGAVTKTVAAKTWAAATGLSGFGKATAMMAANLALTGIQQIMAPDPAVDRDSPTDYLFTGGAQNSTEGDPIPLLYGELRVPGRAISIEVMQGRGSSSDYLTDNVYVDSSGNLVTTAVATAEN